MENRLFFELPVYERKLPRKIGKQKVQVQSRYFHLAFERTISDVPLWSSSRHKMTTFDAYVDKVKKKKKKKLASDYRNAYASHRINKKKKKTREALHKCLCFAPH